MAKGGNNTDGKMNVIILVAFTSFISEYFWVLSTISLLQMPKQTSGSDETQKKKFLDVQRVRGEILFHNHPPSDGHYLSKNGHCFVELIPIFDIFIVCGHIFVPNGVFWGSTSRPHTGDLVMNLFFYFGVQSSWLGTAQKQFILDQKWQDCKCLLRAKVLANKEMLRSLAFDCSWRN